LEFDKWKGEFSVDDEGTLEEEQDKTEDLLTNFVEYIKVIFCFVLSISLLSLLCLDKLLKVYLCP